MTERSGRGEGNMADALRTRRRGRSSDREATKEETKPSPLPARKKAAGKRSDPNYKLAPAYVREETYNRVRQALLDGEVKGQLLQEIEAYGVSHREGRASYSDLVELLMVEWLERVGWGSEAGSF